MRWQPGRRGRSVWRPLAGWRPASRLAMTQRGDPRRVRVAVRDFLADQLGRHEETAAAKALAMTARCAEGEALLDPAMIGRALDNLLTNAIRHAPQGGAVTLTAERAPGLLTLVVEDTGAGVRPDMADRLFEPFVTGRPDGTGLGLATARELADAHGGRVTLRTAGGTPGHGAAFPAQHQGWARCAAGDRAHCGADQ